MKLCFNMAQEVDIEIIYTFCKALIRAYETDPLPMDKVLAWCHRKIEAQLPEYRRIFVDGKHCGYFHLISREADTWELDDFYLFEDCRGQGIGTAVLKMLCDTADEQGAVLQLYVFRKNKGAVRLYQRFGFVKKQEVGNSRWIFSRLPQKKE